MDAIDPAEYLGLVHYLARRTARRLGRAATDAIVFDDLVQAGYLGLLEAIRAFDARRGVPFLSYARPRIEGALLDLLREADVVSRRERWARRDLAARDAELTARLGRPPTTDELAAKTGTSVADVIRLRAPEPSVTVLDDETAAPEGARFVGPEAGAAQEELARAVAGCLAELTPESRLVLRARVLEELTLQSLGRLLGASKDRVWRLEQGARRTVRACLERKGWESAEAIETASGGRS